MLEKVKLCTPYSVCAIDMFACSKENISKTNRLSKLKLKQVQTFPPTVLGFELCVTNNYNRNITDVYYIKPTKTRIV